MQLTGAPVTEPNDDVRRICPKERTNFARNSNGFIDAESLQCLNVKNAIIEIAFGSLVSMNTLPLTKHLSSHDDFTISSRRRSANIEPLLNASGLNK
jgi:hypothetical protein